MNKTQKATLASLKQPYLELANGYLKYIIDDEKGEHIPGITEVKPLSTTPTEELNDAKTYLTIDLVSNTDNELISEVEFSKAETFSVIIIGLKSAQINNVSTDELKIEQLIRDTLLEALNFAIHTEQLKDDNKELIEPK